MNRLVRIFVLAVSCGSFAASGARADEPPSETVVAPPPSAVPGDTAPVLETPPPAPISSAVPAPIAAIAPPAVLRPQLPEPRFGNAGVLVVNGTVGGTIARDAHAFTVAPAIDYFLTSNLSAGGSLLLGYNHAQPSTFGLGNDNWTYGVSARLGFDVWLTERLSLWPKAFVSFEQERNTILVATPAPVVNSMGPPVSAIGSSDVLNIVSAGASVPLLFHPVPHFFIGFGPNVTTELYKTISMGGSLNRTTRFGASTTIGGWL